MFMDKVTIDREALDEVLDASRLLDDPPGGLLAALSWEEGDGQTTMVSLWESPGDRHLPPGLEVLCGHLRGARPSHDGQEVGPVNTPVGR